MREPPPAPAPPAGPPPAAPPPPARSGRPGWLPIALSAAIVLVLAAIVAIILVSTSGKPAAHAQNAKTQSTHLTNTLLASRQLYASTQQPSYSALLPAGWEQVATTLPGLSAATTVQSPVDDGATITVGQVTKPAHTLGRTAGGMLHAARSQTGFHQDASAAAGLVGGRAAWVFAYDANGKSTATYLVSSCHQQFAVSATVPPARVSVLRSRIAIVAGTLQGNC